jgi:hypothetical protein
MNRCRRLVCATTVFGGLAAACAGPAGSEPGAAAVRESTVAETADSVPGEWLVTVRPGVDAADLLTRFRPLGVVEVVPASAGRYLLRFPPERSPSAPQVRKVGAPDVTAVQPNFRYRALPAPGSRVR